MTNGKSKLQEIRDRHRIFGIGYMEDLERTISELERENKDLKMQLSNANFELNRERN